MNISSILCKFATNNATKFLTIRISEKDKYGKKNINHIGNV